MIDQALGYFKLMTFEKLLHQIGAQAMIGFLTSLFLHVFANFVTQSSNRIEVFAQAAGPLIVFFGKFLDAYGGNLRTVFYFLSGQPWRAIVSRIVNDKSFLIVRFHAH